MYIPKCWLMFHPTRQVFDRYSTGINGLGCHGVLSGVVLDARTWFCRTWHVLIFAPPGGFHRLGTWRLGDFLRVDHGGPTVQQFERKSTVYQRNLIEVYKQGFPIAICPCWARRIPDQTCRCPARCEGKFGVWARHHETRAAEPQRLRAPRAVHLNEQLAAGGWCGGRTALEMDGKDQMKGRQAGRQVGRQAGR